MKRPLFFVGLHQPYDARLVEKAMISVNRLEHRISDFEVHDWLLDSGAFTRITTGRGHMPLKDYAQQIERWNQCGNLLAAVAQDWMCEPFVLDITGLTVQQHQTMTVNRYRDLRDLMQGTHLMPVIQGYAPKDYANHIQEYGEDLLNGMWVGVGSVCKRNGSPREVEAVLDAIQELRPDLRLHGFGIKLTALAYERVCEGFYSCDSMAWSFAARKKGRNPNDPKEALRYIKRLDNQPVQYDMML